MEQSESLRQALQEAESAEREEVGDSSSTHVDCPPLSELRFYALHNAVPFVFFGFLDNSIMLLAGDYIEASMGVRFGISTLCAAGMGNIVSNVAGLWLGNTVQAGLSRLNLRRPLLTEAQRALPQASLAKLLGMAGGTVFGCILGMFPLIWPKEWRLW
jgi:tRNA-specific adenosine deaminase 1